jgi:tetratricopeptide (TPR) repeat protein
VATFPRLRNHAIEHFEQATAAAMEAQCFPLLLNIAFNLGNLYFAHKQWALALEHFEAAESVATACFNANAALLCIEKRGECHYKLKEWGLVQKAWKDGVEIARATKEDEARKRLLGRLRDIYQEARMRDHVTVVEAELRSLS